MSTSASPTVANFLGKLQGVKQSGTNWYARCPCRNDDSNPSLSIGEGRDGRVLATCHRGNPCTLDQICDAMGIAHSDLFPKTDEKQVKVPVKSEKLAKNLSLIATYDYMDELGELLFQKQRFVDESGKKTFRQRKPDGEGGWSYQLGEVPRVLYRLPQILAAKANSKTIWVVEGEKDVDTLVDAGYEATTMPNGAGSWTELHTDALAGAHIILISDNDEVGQQHALDVAEQLRNAGCTVKLGIPPSGYKDVTDLYDDGKTVKDLTPFEEYNNSVDESQPEEEEDNIGELLGGLEKILRRDDISEDARLARAGILINTFARGADVDTGRLVHWEDFLTEEDDDSYDWVIPGVIEKQERVIVVAAEGVGKTMLARQVAICAAAGINPFTMSKMEPVRTLTVDLENPERIIRRTSRNIMSAARTLGHSTNILAELLTKPAGLDLLKMSDRAVLEKAIEEAKPQLLVMGPLYKAFLDPGGRTSESIAIEVARYLDGLRDAYGVALWLEHHAPLGSSMGSRDLRPFGSAVWSRWPEFGLSLTPDPTATEGYVYNVTHFRGARDRRKFPTKMRRGRTFPFEVLEFMKVDE